MSFRTGESSQWPAGTEAGTAIPPGVLVLDADSEWALDTDSSVTADGYLVLDADGDLAIDDAVSTGLDVMKAPVDLHAID